MTVSADTWHLLGSLDDLGIGGKKEISLPDGKLVLLLRTQSGLYACCADCPHQDTPLAEGMLEEDVLTCPLHFWQWNINTGEAIGIAEEPLKTFELRQQNGAWFIRI